MNNKPKTTWIVTTVIALFAIVAGTYYSIRPKPQAENSNASADASLTFNTPSLNSNINTTLSPKLTINPTTNGDYRSSNHRNMGSYCEYRNSMDYCSDDLCTR